MRAQKKAETTEEEEEHMPFHVGDRVWLACEVKLGPFSNERLVRIQLPAGSWLGFVDTRALKKPVETGSTYVLASITAIKDNNVTAIVQGHAIETRQVQASTAKVQPFGSLSL